MVKKTLSDYDSVVRAFHREGFYVEHDQGSVVFTKRLGVEEELEIIFFDSRGESFLVRTMFQNQIVGSVLSEKELKLIRRFLKAGR